MKRFLLVAVLCCFLTSTFASDHIDSPAVDFRAGDITDYFVFPQHKDGKTTLVLGLTVHVLAGKKSKFATDVEYSFHVRPATLNGYGSSFAVATQNEYVVSCFFKNEGKGQVMDCQIKKEAFGTFENITSSSIKVGDLNGGSNGTVQVFAGRRADPFFCDLVRVGMKRPRNKSYNDTGFPFPGILPKNPSSLTNVLAIVVELDVNEVFGPGQTIFATAAHTKIHKNGTVEYVDRIGRPEITNFIMGQFSTSNEKFNKVKVQWNAESNSFAIDERKRNLYRETIENGLRYIDNNEKVDDGSSPTDWTYPHPLVDILIEDFLVVDVSKPAHAGTKSFFEIEMARFQNREHQTCGGRLPNDDVVDAIVTLLMNGPDRKTPVRGDGISGQPRKATDKFPYLGSTSFWGKK